MNSLKIAALALVAVLIVAGCGVAAPGRPTPAVCTTSASKGTCGPFNDPQITETTSSTYVNNNVWNPITGWRQALAVTTPGSWRVTANIPARTTAVVSYPSVGGNYGQTNDTSTPLSDYASIYSSFSENMHATSRTSAWAAYDIWLGQGSSPNWSSEVMIQHDFANNGACASEAAATFGGSGGVPVQTWNLCQFGSELVWKLPANETAGRVDILPMLRWLVTRGYLPANSGLWAIGYGWEICSTGGVNENFQVNHFSIITTASGRA
jgi:hypothetical protein